MNVMVLNDSWSYMKGLSLTAINLRWLANHLIEMVERTKSSNKKKPIEFPQKTKDYKLLPKVFAMTLEQQSKDVDLKRNLKVVEKKWI